MFFLVDSRGSLSLFLSSLFCFVLGRNQTKRDLGHKGFVLTYQSALPYSLTTLVSSSFFFTTGKKNDDDDDDDVE